jgi:hypothetical protein
MKLPVLGYHILIVLLAGSLLVGCRSDKVKYDIPETYDFENVSYSGQTSRMDMVDEIVAYLETATTPGTVLDGQHLHDMFENQNNPFTFSSTKQLKDKCFLADQDLIETWLDLAANVSTSTTPAAQGVPGIATSNDGLEHFLMDENGNDVIELIEKGLMGAVFYYQSVGVYLSESKTGSTIDNETVTAGEGTTLQHHWDEAFGYFGAAIDFPTNATARYWAKACLQREALLPLSDTIMSAFVTGRAAINHDDHKTKEAQVLRIRDNWEKVIAATVIHELNEARSHLNDDALRNHEVSEAKGYLLGLQYNPTKKISDSDWLTVYDTLGGDLYAITLAQIDSARTKLAEVYGLTAIKDQL